MKERILIANRGEIAIRIMQACEALGLDHVVVYTPEDRYSMHVRMAAKAFQIASYKDPNDIFEVADHAKCTAIHPGYGFFSENFRFARRAAMRSRPVRFIGPRWEVIRDLGSKINTKKVAKDLGIPVIPGTDRPIYNEIEAEGIAEWLFLLQKEQGVTHPSILVKASAGGGGMGIEEVNHLNTFRRVYRRIQSYSKRQFGDEGVLIEQCLRDYHHLEVQLVCSQHSEISHFGTRNCTIQSTGRQKRVEVAPGFDPDYCTYPFNAQKVLERIVAYSVKMAKHVQYDNVGTWEWVVTRDGNPYLLEVNTRIQVENGISARIARIKGTDGYPNIVKEQIRVAFGDRLGYSQEDISFSGTSIELRIVAEDARRGFKPWCGAITRFAPYQADWVNVHTHIPPDLSYFIPTEYDPNLALAIIWGQNTAEAVERAHIFIKNTQIEGKDSHDQTIITNLPYLQEKLNDVLKF